MARQSDRIDEWETEDTPSSLVPFFSPSSPFLLLDITNIMDIASIINPTTPDDPFTYCSSTPKPFFLNTMSPSSNTPSPTDSVFHVCVSESTCHRHPPGVLPKKQPNLDDDERVPVPPLHAMPIKKRPLQHPDHNDNSKGIRRRKRGLEDPVSLLSLSIHKPRPRTNKRHPTTKKAETNAALAYDTIDPEAPESEVFDASCWIPDIHVFDAKPTVSVRWKGTPLDIRSCKYYERLHPGEVAIASTLRLFPEQYIRCKRALILAAQDAYKNNTPFRKSEAQKLCRIDVNKISHLWSAFGRLGWLGPKWPGSNMINNSGSATL